MASKILLSVFLLVCVGVSRSYIQTEHPQGDHHSTTSEGDLENACTRECPDFELLCSRPEYDVRRYKSALWVSTTMSDLSLSQASGRGRKRLHDYFGGANDKRLKMSYTAPLVTQTRAPSESPVREITVSMPLPTKVAKNPPKPRDPRVVIDLVPEVIMYVKKFGRRSPKVGFVADLEAKNFYKTLKATNEPLHENDGYYYIAQYDSSDSSDHNMYNEIGVFAMNERTYKWLEFNDLTADGQGLPKCLRGNDEAMVWEKMDQSDIPLLTREQCSTTYCQAPRKCPKFEREKVKGIDDKTIMLKYPKDVNDIQSLAYVPPTCYYDTAVHASASPLFKALNTSGITLSEVGVTITVAMEKRDELDGEKSCQKFFKVVFLTGGARGKGHQDVQMKKEAGLQTPKTLEAIHQEKTTGPSDYSKCFGGNAYYEPTTITSTAKMLMERLRDKKKCFLGDHISVVEYHPQSRLFDRYNEIDLDADLDCSDQEGRPPFTFHLPVSKDYSRTEARPSLGDRCDTHECPKITTIMGLENNLKIVEYAGNYFHSKSPSKSCSNTESHYKALNPLLSYLNGKNEDSSKIDMTKPLYGKLDLFGQRCEKVTTFGTIVPEKFADNPPKPIDDTVSFERSVVESRWFRSLYKGRYGSGELERHLNDMISDLDNLKPFGVEYNVQELWIGTYDDPGTEEGLFEFVIEGIRAPKESQGDDRSEETGEKRKEDTSDGKVTLPKPEGCRECATVYVTKNHSNFMELSSPNSRSLCHRTKLCGHPQTYGRQLIRPILGYFDGDNSANEKINNTGVPETYTKVYSAEEEQKGIAPCERAYMACVALSDEYKELPKPNGKGTWVGYFSYDKPLTNPEEKITYFLFPKKTEDKGEEPSDGDSNETEN
ncbi:HEBP2 [Branchiostoma lanceolatum]|uniref:HEBP2 protein n=1 Tax=Branchiostoma lanceolatum TaxID=7740 RepID=A0A8K0AD28_BRALA|nr:HEBP2 [Branchiostoma lanceolatum]